MAITLAMVAKTEKTPLRKLIIQNLLRHCPLLEYLPFENVSALRSVAVRWTNLPGVAFRDINEDYTADEGDVEQVYENVYAFGGEIEVDRVWEKVRPSLIKDPEQLQIEMKTEAMAITFCNYFITGDHASDPKGFEGLKKRIANMPARQSVRASSTTDILDPTASAANARRFLNKWEEAFYKAGGGKESPNVILMNEGMYWGFGQVLRYQGAAAGTLMDQTKDQFDRELLTYKGVPFIDMGYKTDQSTEIIPHNETAEDAGTDATSVYFVPFNDEQGVIGIQLDPLETFDGKKNKSTTDIITVEWWVGLAGFGSYGPVRLHNIETPNSWT